MLRPSPKQGTPRCTMVMVYENCNNVKKSDDAQETLLAAYILPLARESPHYLQSVALF